MVILVHEIHIELQEMHSSTTRASITQYGVVNFTTAVTNDGVEVKKVYRAAFASFRVNGRSRTLSPTPLLIQSIYGANFVQVGILRLSGHKLTNPSISTSALRDKAITIDLPCLVRILFTNSLFNENIGQQGDRFDIATIPSDVRLGHNGNSFFNHALRRRWRTPAVATSAGLTSSPGNG